MHPLVDLAASSDDEDEVLIEDVNDESESDSIEVDVIMDSLDEDLESDDSDSKILSEEEISTEKLLNRILKTKTRNVVPSLTSAKHNGFNFVS